MDDRDLAQVLDTHLYDHRERNPDCVVCAVILAHHAEWRHHRDVVVTVPALAHDDHDYLSTACEHQRHDECRRTCKFCANPCGCWCHDPKQNPRGGEDR